MKKIWGLVLVLLCISSSAFAERRDFWLWAEDARFEESASPCATGKMNPARKAIREFIGEGTPQRAMVSYVRIEDSKLDLVRDGVLDMPAKRYVDNNKIPISIWYRGNRTWVITIYVPPKTPPATALVSPAFISVTLVMEANEKREGKPVCHERWIGAVSP